MSHVIYKYPLFFDHERKATVKLSPDSKILDVQVQGRTIVLWAVVQAGGEFEPNLVPRVFRMYGTGRDIDGVEVGKLQHIATVQESGYVWHIFEEVS